MKFKMGPNDVINESYINHAHLKICHLANFGPILLGLFKILSETCEFTEHFQLAAKIDPEVKLT
jgi:hypothetical protein